MYTATRQCSDPWRLGGKRALITRTGPGHGAAAQALFCHARATVLGCDVIASAAEQSTERLRRGGLDVAPYGEMTLGQSLRRLDGTR
jgi:hypothetical protein